MYGKQLDRVAKRVRVLDDMVDRLKTDRRCLEEYLQEEFIDFVTRNAGAKFAELDSTGNGNHTVTIHLTATITISFCTNGNPGGTIRRDKRTFGYCSDTTGAITSHITNDPVPEYIENKLRHLFQDVLPAWRNAVDTLDVEALMTTRVLWWISKELPGGCWADVIEGNLIKMI